jgi:hypothetical protein
VFKRQVWAISLASGCMLLILVLLVAFGKIKPQTFALDCIGVMLVMFVAFYVFFKTRNTLGGEQGKTDREAAKGRSVRSYALTAVLTIFLVFGWWSTRGGPLAPRLVGTAVDLVLIWAILRLG